MLPTEILNIIFSYLHNYERAGLNYQQKINITKYNNLNTVLHYKLMQYEGKFNIYLQCFNYNILRHCFGYVTYTVNSDLYDQYTEMMNKATVLKKISNIYAITMS